MDRNKAMDKVKKLLALANDKGAMPSEAALALKKANDLASKYGIEIVKRSSGSSSNFNSSSNTRGYNFKAYRFHINCYDAKLVKFLFDKLGIKHVGYDKSTKEVFFTTLMDFSVNGFLAYYKKFQKVHYYTKKKVGIKNYTEWFIQQFNNCYLCGIPSKFYDINVIVEDFNNAIRNGYIIR